MARLRKVIGLATAAALLLGSGLFAFPVWAGYVVKLKEVESGVVATGSGPIDLTGLNFDHIAAVSALVGPASGAIVTGPGGSEAGTSVLLYSKPLGPTSFGGGGTTVPNTSSGNAAGIFADLGAIAVPQGYASNDPLSNTATYAGQTFSSLGATPGTYVWKWGAGPNQNFTLIIGTSAAVPEPASAVLLGTALAGLLLAGAIRRIRG
jgi:hypothetical protein